MRKTNGVDTYVHLKRAHVFGELPIGRHRIWRHFVRRGIALLYVLATVFLSSPLMKDSLKIDSLSS